ncbi:MAG: formylglycine-generating enzyme family protein, partial [Bernardetiaceae bacterium]
KTAPNAAKHPVESVSWDDAVAFCQMLSELTGKAYALPSETQWEYAAKGGQQSKGFEYAGSNEIDKVAWYNGNAKGTTHPVGEPDPNELGLYDMSGNVWEWCADDWHGDYKGAPQDGSAWVDNPRGPGRVLRGGSWLLNAQHCRVANRFSLNPNIRSYDIGFRLCLFP